MAKSIEGNSLNNRFFTLKQYFRQAYYGKYVRMALILKLLEIEV